MQGCAQITKVLGHKLAALVVVATADDDGGMEAKMAALGNSNPRMENGQVQCDKVLTLKVTPLPLAFSRFN